MIPKDLFQEICTRGQIIEVEKGDILIHEGKEHSHFYLILEGEIELFNRKKGDLRVSVLKKGSFVGGMALVDQKNCVSSAKANTDAKLLRLEIDRIDESLSSELICYLAEDLSERLKQVNEITIFSLNQKIEEEKSSSLMGMILVQVLVLLGVYLLLFRLMLTRMENVNAVFIVLMGFLGCTAFYIMKKSKFPLSAFGIASKNWKKSLVEGFLFTLPVLAAIVLLKWALMKEFGLSYPLFQPAPLSLIDAFFVFGYALLSPLQELIARGAFQSLLTRLIPGGRTQRVWTAILLSNLLFTTFHSYLGIGFTAAVFIPGLFFGWLYQRHQNLLGVSLSHAMVGIWALYFVNVWPFLMWRQ